MASQTPGATTVEAVDLVDLTDFGAGFNPEAADALTRSVKFAAGVMTQLAPQHCCPGWKRYEEEEPAIRRRSQKQR